MKNWHSYIVAAVLAALILILGGCDTVPESVMEANNQRLEKVEGIVGLLTDARNEKPMVDVAVNLPPGIYEVPDSGWELARIQVHEPMTAIGLASLDNTDWQISENVAITALRVIAPLAGFLGGQYFTNEALKTSAQALTTVGMGNTQLAQSLGSQAIATGPALGAPAVAP